MEVPRRARRSTNLEREACPTDTLHGRRILEVAPRCAAIPVLGSAPTVTSSHSQTPDPLQLDTQATLLGHPVGLYVLFFTEMWERFSFYGMRALLTLYMVNHLFSDDDRMLGVLGMTPLRGGLESVFGPLETQPLASQVYGLYTGLVYLTPFFGGLIADRFWGQRRTVVVGCVLMAIGHFLMAIESAFLVALGFLILGNGCFKPNTTTQVGMLYPPGDPRRDAAYSIFYMGINLGAMLAPLIAGTMGQAWGWHWGFGAAGVGMLLGMVVYLAGQRYLAPDPKRVSADELAMESSVGGRGTASRSEGGLTRGEWGRIAALVVLCSLNIVFWAVYEQQGNTMQLWADQRTDWNLGGIEIPSTWFQAFNPLFIILLTPLLTMWWAYRREKGAELSSVLKMAIGCGLVGLAFVVMILASYAVPEGQRGSVLWLLGTVLVLTIGEIYLSPIGLSLVSKVAPTGWVSMLMGVWFLSSFLGNYLSGLLGMFYTIVTKDQFFLMLAALGVLAGLAMAAINTPLQRMLGGKV